MIIKSTLQNVMYERELVWSEKMIIIEHFIGDRLTNYGYAWRDFRNMSSKASRLRGQLRKIYNSHLLNKNYGIFGRVVVELSPLGTIVAVKEYITGQSYNEELITLYECFLEKL